MKTHSHERDNCTERVVKRMERAYKHPLTKGKFMERISRAKNPHTMLLVAAADGMIMHYEHDLETHGRETALYNLRHHYENTGKTHELSFQQLAERGFCYKNGHWEKNGNGHRNGESVNTHFAKPRGFSDRG